MRGEYRTHASPRLRVHICRLPPYAAYHVCMSVCLSIGLSDICANSKCERKRPGLGRALADAPSTHLVLSDWWCFD